MQEHVSFFNSTSHFRQKKVILDVPKYPLVLVLRARSSEGYRVNEYYLRSCYENKYKLRIYYIKMCHEASKMGIPILGF